MTNLYIEARAMAKEALEECDGDIDEAREWIAEACDNHEVAIYHHRAIEFCARNDTSDGEDWLEDVGDIAQPGDTFGAIACRVAYATLLCACEEQLEEIAQEAAEEAA